MSFSTVKVAAGKEDLIVDIPATDAVNESANATPESDVTAATGSKFFWGEIDARDNPNEDVILKLYDKATTPTVGTDHPHIALPGKRGKITQHKMPVGVVFTNDINAAVCQAPGATAGSSNPTGIVKVRLGIKIAP